LRPLASIIGDDASTSVRGGDLLALAPESPMARSVEREDCAESGGDCFCCEARRRLWGGKLSLGL
jgi:hypothetical protein